jgi:hypothetical protein
MSKLNRWSMLVLLAALTGGEARSESPKRVDPLNDVRFLIGRWSGISEGQAGTGSVSRVYEPILNGRFVHERNRSEYPAQAPNPKGEVHEHWSFLSYDKVRQAILLRQFHVEGFVITYRLATPTGTDRRLVFEAEQIDNLPGEWKARETYERLSEDEFTETFDLAAPGKPFEVYGKARLKRTR